MSERPQVSAALATEARTFADAVRLATEQEMERDPSVFAYGEGINDPGGFFGSTVGLASRFGPERCLDVPNSEEALAGFGLGAALGGLRPLFVNLRTEFLLLAVNQLVNHAAKWGAMRGDDVAVPLTVRAMVGRGWGQGAQHSGSYAAMFAHVPGLNVAVPSSPSTGAALVVAALRGRVPTLLVEPKAVYDAGPEQDVPVTTAPARVGRAEVRRSGAHITLVAVGDGVARALRVAEQLSPHGVEAEVVDALWFRPFDAETVLASVAKTGACGVLDIGWDDYGLAAQVAKVLATAPAPPLRRRLLSWAPDGHAPAGCFAEASHYPSDDQVLRDVLSLLA